MDYNKREDVSNIYKWDLTPRYKDDTEWYSEYTKISKTIDSILKYKGKILTTPDNLLKCLDELFATMQKLDKLLIYANLRSDENVDDKNTLLMVNQIYSLYNKYTEYSSFIVPEILSGNKTKLNTLLKDKNLKKYAFYLKNIIRYKDHTLTADEEKLMVMLTPNSSTFEQINTTLIDSLLNYGSLIVDNEEKVITSSNYNNIMQNQNRNTRKECYLQMSSKLHEFSNVLAISLVANMKDAWAYAQAKKFSSTIDMELFSSNIPICVVNNLYDVVHKRLNVFQKYLTILKKHLGLEELYYYDLRADFLSNNITFSIEDAQILLLNAFSIYGKEYTDIIQKAFNEKWIDYCSYKGKKSGAYSTSNYGNNPVVLANFHGKFNDVSALAHELGHAVNFYLSAKNNEYHESNNDIFVAEVASLTNEIILSNYVIKNSKDHNLKMIAIYNLISFIQDNLFDACLEGELELKTFQSLEKGEEINSEILDNTIYNIRKQYYGNAVTLDDNVKYMWAKRFHYFYPYYLFKYATGISAAIYIASKIIDGDLEMKKNYLKFLGKGDSNYPVDLLKNIGVDMTSPEVIETAIKFLDNLLDEFSKVSEE